MILILTMGVTTAKLVYKYRPSMPIPSVVVPEVSTSATKCFEWWCSDDELPAIQGLVYRGVVPVLCFGINWSF